MMMMELSAVIAFLALGGALLATWGISKGSSQKKKMEGLIQTSQQLIPISVNYHFTRQCNYSCGFCFHTAKSKTHLELEDAKKGLSLLKDAGMKKVNFSGGEPFLIEKGKYLGEMVRYCKLDLKLESVTIVSNGSLITESWFQTYGQCLDILAISCDSFDDKTNDLIGRKSGKGNHVEKVYQIKEWCNLHNVKFKINSVINTYNVNEDMTAHIRNLNPVRWKIFQCLILEGENTGNPGELKNAQKFVISSEQFQNFLKRHESLECMVPEDNETMKDSYLILDEKMRFLDCTSGKKIPSESILEVGVEKALRKSGFNGEMFHKRKGVYDWTKESDVCKSNPELSW